MTLTLTRNQRKEDGTFKDGCSDAWSARIEGVTYSGIGKSRVEAIGSLFNANLPFFGVHERIDIDPAAMVPTITWRDLLTPYEVPAS